MVTSCRRAEVGLSLSRACGARRRWWWLCAQGKEYEELEAEAKEECDRLREVAEELKEQAEAAQSETDLKRETSRKLKEEIIDNDRLTVANLNRIKHLEELCEKQQAALEEAEGENSELRKELSTAINPQEAEEEITALRELLTERESQLMSLSRRLADFEHGSPEGRRHSFLDRLGASMKTHVASSSA